MRGVVCLQARTWEYGMDCMSNFMAVVDTKIVRGGIEWQPSWSSNFYRVQNSNVVGLIFLWGYEDFVTNLMLAVNSFDTFVTSLGFLASLLVHMSLLNVIIV